MRQIPISHSLLTYLDDLEFTEAALLASEDTVDLAVHHTEELESWGAMAQKERLARREVTRSEAVVSVKNAVLDGTTTKFGVGVLGEAGGDRKSAFFRRFFSAVPSEFVRRPLRKQAEATLQIMLAELERLAADHPLRAYVAPLKAQAEGALAALDARTKAKSARSVSAHEVEEWKEGVNTLRLSTYAELLKRAADGGKGRGWADAFFRSDAAVASGDEEGTDPAAGPATPPANPA
ncbi:MAG: hypothetical protein U0271_45040 [Polyangiaceae bacterium]